MGDAVDMSHCLTLLDQISKGLQEKRLDRKGLIKTVETCAEKLKSISEAQEERFRWYEEQLKNAQAATTATTSDGYTIAYSPSQVSDQVATTDSEVNVEGQWAQLQHAGHSFIIEGVAMNVEDGRIIIGGNSRGGTGLIVETSDRVESDTDKESKIEDEGHQENISDQESHHILQEHHVYSESDDQHQELMQVIHQEQTINEQQIDTEMLLEELKRQYGPTKFKALHIGAKNGNLKSFIEYGLVNSYECSSAPSVKNVYGCLLSPKCKSLIFKHNLTCLRHILAEHWGGYKPHKCNFCDHRTYLRQQMNLHTPQHTGEGKHKCSFEGCDYSTSSSKAWKIHKAKHNGVFLFYCDMCSKGYYNKKDLDAHQNGHYGVNPFVCKLCKKGFKRKVHLTRHTLYHIKPIKCPIEDCDYRTAQNNKLREHLVSVHHFTPVSADGSSQAQLIIDGQGFAICGTAVADGHALGSPTKSPRKPSKVLERRIQNGVRQRDDGTIYYRCVINDCDSTFDSEEIFRTHVYGHFPIPENFPCKQCDKVFASIKERNIHVRYGHLMKKNTGFKLLPNAKPNEGSMSRGKVQNSMQPISMIQSRTISSNEQARNSAKTLVCRFPGCQFACADDNKLANHQLAKHRIRPFSLNS